MAFEWLTLSNIAYLFALIFLFFVYECVFKHWNYFKTKNVRFLRGLPFLGAQYKAFLGIKSLSDSFKEIYNKFPNDRFIGMYDLGGNPFYMIRDPELIKQITIKDFDHFTNHMLDVHETSDPLLARNMFTMRDKRWKDMRSTLSPAFTGSRMRLMFGLIVDVTNRFSNHLDNLIKSGKDVYELKDIFTSVASDAIASCAFGVESNSIQNKKNHFYECGEAISNFGLKFIGYTTIPSVMNFFKVRIFNDKHTNFFRQVVKQNIEYRQKNNVKRNDMIDILIEAKKGTLKHSADDHKYDDIGIATVSESDWGQDSELHKWTDDDLAAQCMLFFLAGFNGISLLMCFAAHELAVNQNVQQTLYEEIREVQKELKGTPINYDKIQKMHYLDKVISETLRKYPIGTAGDRMVAKPYEIENIDGSKVRLNVGDGVWLPIAGIHWDPQYFPNPEKFDPDRFNEENRPSNFSSIYTPFGTGPRNCIGNRFALMETKAAIYQLVASFKLEKSEKTLDPLPLKKLTVNVEAANGFWVKILKRTK